MSKSKKRSTVRRYNSPIDTAKEFIRIVAYKEEYSSNNRIWTGHSSPCRFSNHLREGRYYEAIKSIGYSGNFAHRVGSMASKKAKTHELLFDDRQSWEVAKDQLIKRAEVLEACLIKARNFA